MQLSMNYTLRENTHHSNEIRWCGPIQFYIIDDAIYVLNYFTEMEFTKSFATEVGYTDTTYEGLCFVFDFSDLLSTQS